MGTYNRLRALAVVSAVIVTIAAAPTFASLIETGSPGSMAQISRIAQTCPTFSWSLIQDATGYELVVYRLPDTDESSPGALEGIDPEGDAAPALRSSVPAGVSAWSPSLDQCLNAEASYAWLVRPVFAESEGEWSEARMFAVDQAAAQGDLRKTLEDMVEQILEKREKQLGRPVRQRPVTAVPTVHGPRVAGTPESIEAGIPLDGRSALLGELPPPVPSEITFGLRGIVENTFAGSAGVLGESLAATGVTHGVRGITQSGSGTSSGVLGESIEGVTYGVQGVTTSDSADARGVLGKTFAENGVAVEGISSNPAGIGVGVRGAAAGDGARGLEGVASDGGSGVSYGVRGTTFSSMGRGVFGLASASGGGRGVAGASVSASGFGGYFENSGEGGTGLAASGGGSTGADLLLTGTGRVKVDTAEGNLILVEPAQLEGGVDCLKCIGLNGDSEPEIDDQAVATLQLADSAVTTPKIAALAVVTGKINDSAVTSVKIADGEVMSVDIGDGEVKTIDIGDGEVKSVDIGDSEVMSIDIADGEVKSVDIGNLEVTTLDLADNAVTSIKILDGDVRAADIGAGEVRTAEILDNTILSEDIRDGEVKSDDIAANAVFLTTQTTGSYISNIIGGGGLKLVGLEGSSVALKDCPDDQVLRRDGGVWDCFAGVSTFDAIGTGVNTSATMTLGIGSQLVSEGGKIVFGTGGGIETKDNVVLPVVHEDTLITPSSVMSLAHRTVGAVAAGMGASLLLQAENDSEVLADVGRFSASMTTVTAGSEDSTLKFFGLKSGLSTEVMSVDHNGNLTATVAASNLSGTVAPANGGTGISTSGVGAGSIFYSPAFGTWGTLPGGSDGKVLKMAAGLPAWGDDSNAGGTVTSVDSGTGLTGGPITATGTLSIDTAVVPQLGVANTFTTGAQTVETGAVGNEGIIVKGFSGQTANLQEWQDDAALVLASVDAAGAISASSFTGTGTGLTNVPASSLTGTVAPANGGTGLDTSATSTGSVLYTSGSGTWGTLSAGTDGQVLKLAGGVPTWAADAAGPGTVTSVGSGTGLSGGPITGSGSLAIDTAVVPRLAAANTFTSGVQTFETGVAGTKGVIVKGAAAQTASLQEWQDSGGTVLASVAGDGTFSATSVNLDVASATFIVPVETASPTCTIGTVYVKDNAGAVDALCVCMDDPMGAGLDLVNVTGNGGSC